MNRYEFLPMNAWSLRVKKALGSYGTTCYLFLSGRQDFRRQEIDDDYDDDSTNFKMFNV